MPRGVHATRILPILTKRAGPPPKTSPQGPKLYNAKRRTKTALGLTSHQHLTDLQHNVFSNTWRTEVSKDVTQFVDDMEAQGTKLLPEEQRALLKNPAHYFSRPENVPTVLREQVYFPNFSVAMRRQTRYGPYYAQFEVPLWFSKLDLKGYLKQVYNVDVVHIRSYNTPAVVTRKMGNSKYNQGALYRLRSRKRMTVQLVEPFEWPVKPENIDRKPFESEQYWRSSKLQHEESKYVSDDVGILLDREHRKSIAEQAEDILAGRAEWRPTWKSLPDKAKMLDGLIDTKVPQSVVPGAKAATKTGATSKNQPPASVVPSNARTIRVRT